MGWKPNRWLALALGFLVPPLAFLYVRRWVVAIAYLFVGIAGIAIEGVLNGPGVFALLLNIACSAYAYRVASSADPVAKRYWYGRWYGLLSAALGFVAAAILARALLLEPLRSPSSAMEPTLPLGAVFVISKLGYGNVAAFGMSVRAGPPWKRMKRGAIVVFFDPRNTPRQFVKRIVGLPGDMLEYRDKALSVNGAALARARVPLDTYRTGITEEIHGTTYQTIVDKRLPAEDWSVVVPQGGYFVMGDNRDVTEDSRHFGAVKGELLVGELAYGP